MEMGVVLERLGKEAKLLIGRQINGLKGMLTPVASWMSKKMEPLSKVLPRKINDCVESFSEKDSTPFGV